MFRPIQKFCQWLKNHFDCLVHQPGQNIFYAGQNQNFPGQNISFNALKFLLSCEKDGQ